MTTVTLNGNTYNDTATPPLNMGNGGHRTNLFPMLSDAVVDLAAKQSAAAASAATATTQASNAAASAASAAALAGAFVGTSTTSLGIGLGTKVFATQAGESYTNGIWMTAVSAANAANYMAGQVTYSGTTLTMTVTLIGGSGTYADWNLSLAGVAGPAGPTFTGGSLSSAINTARATVASHATTADIWGAAGNQIDWTGVATTVAFPNAPQAGASRTLICAGACSFTAGANMLIAGVSSGNTITCATNDKIIVDALSTTQVHLSRIKYDGTAQVSNSSPTIVRSARTSNTILASGDNSTLIDITSGTFSQTFTAAATLASGWFCYIRNSGTGDITLDPNGSELIDGLTTFVMYGGETRLVQCTGTAFTSVVLSPFYRAFITTETFTKPPGYASFGARIWSGGASGGKGPGADATSRGGGGGGCSDFTLLASNIAATETITVGAGGASITTNGTIGAFGGNSSFGALAIVYTPTGANYSNGGSVVADLISVGLAVWQSASGYEGGDTVTSSRRTIWGGGSSSSDGSQPSGACVYGAGAGGSISATVSRAGGASVVGGAGGAGSVVGNAVGGTAPGGGGGAALNSIGNSGAGARGEVRIWGIA